VPLKPRACNLSWLARRTGHSGPVGLFPRFGGEPPGAFTAAGHAKQVGADRARALTEGLKALVRDGRRTAAAALARLLPHLAAGGSGAAAAALLDHYAASLDLAALEAAGGEASQVRVGRRLCLSAFNQEAGWLLPNVYTYVDMAVHWSKRGHMHCPLGACRIATNLSSIGVVDIRGWGSVWGLGFR
jgi:hypothetical protein